MVNVKCWALSQMTAALALAIVMTTMFLLTLPTVKIPLSMKLVTVAMLILHFVAGFSNYAWNILPQPDAAAYQAQAAALANNLEPALFASGKEAWPEILSWLYIVGGVHISLGLLWNAILATAVLPIVYLTSELMRTGSGRMAATLLIIMPGWWLWSSTLIREPTVWFLIALVGYCLARMFRGARRMIIPITGLCILLAWVRGPVSVLLIAGATSAILVSKGRISARIMSISFVLLGSLYFAGNQIASIKSLDPSSFASTRAYLAIAGSGFVYQSPALTLLRVLSGPWPWEIPSLGYLVIPDVLYVWASIGICIKGARRLGQRYLWLAIPALSIAAGIALTASNYGLLVRLRTMFLILTVPIVAAGLEAVKHGGVTAAPEVAASHQLGTSSNSGRV